MTFKNHGPGGCCCEEGDLGCCPYANDFTEVGYMDQFGFGGNDKTPFQTFTLMDWIQSQSVLVPGFGGKGRIRNRGHRWVKGAGELYDPYNLGSCTITYWVSQFDGNSIFLIRGFDSNPYLQSNRYFPAIGITASGTSIYAMHTSLDQGPAPWGGTQYLPGMYDVATSKDAVRSEPELAWVLPGARTNVGLSSGINKIEIRTGFSRGLARSAELIDGIDDGGDTTVVPATGCTQVYVNDQLAWNSVGCGSRVDENVYAELNGSSSIYALSQYDDHQIDNAESRKIWVAEPADFFPSGKYILPVDTSVQKTFVNIHAVEWCISDGRNGGSPGAYVNGMGNGRYCGSIEREGDEGCPFNHISAAPYHQGSTPPDTMSASLNISMLDGDITFSGTVADLDNSTNDAGIYEKIYEFGTGPDATWNGGPSIFSYKIWKVEVKPMKFVGMIGSGGGIGKGIASAYDILLMKVYLQRSGSTAHPSGWFGWEEPAYYAKQIHDGSDAGATSLDFVTFRDDGNSGSATVTVTYQ